MKERPILMSAPMVRALLDGSKTVTRRVLKLRAADLLPEGNYLHGGSVEVALKKTLQAHSWRFQNGRHFALYEYTTVANLACPYGLVGDRLWVRETWEPDYYGDGFCYRADSLFVACSSPALKWRPSIHMPRAASRITLELTDVSIERLQNIDESGAEAEGTHHAAGHGSADDGLMDCHLRGFVPCYRDLWDSIHGFGAFDTNPFVWVIKFKRVAP